MVKLSFESQNLVVDWISFKFQKLESSRQIKIADYFFKLGFNSYQESGKLAKPIKEPILVNSRNQLEVCFIKEVPYWEGVTLQFSGLNAEIFYKLIKQKVIYWKLFSSATLGRFDLYYFRNNEIKDRISVKDFLGNCQRELKQTNKNVSLEKNRKGWILRLGSRRSDNYSRIYETRNSLKFEHEMKGKFLQDCHLLAVSNLNNFEEFENKLSKHFLYHFVKMLPLHYSYLDWLVIQLRPIRKQRIFQAGLSLDYTETNSSQLFKDRRKFVSLLQFLAYAQTLNYERGSLGSTSYRLVTFRVQDFLKYQNPTVKPTNYYQLKKLINFFDKLQTNSFIKSFTDTEYRSLVTIPEVKLQKSKQNCWIAKVWIVEELFYHTHPFFLPDFFQQKITKYEFDVRFKVIQVFSSINIMKEFFIKEFLDSYPSVLSNQQKTKIKRSFIQSIQILEKYDLIENNYKIIFNGSFYDTQELTTRNISEGVVIYEKLSI